jgi:thymidylate kinase
MPGQTSSQTESTSTHYRCRYPFELGQGHTRKDFLCTLFKSLDAHDVRYCVLHSWEELPEKLSSDLDIAVHPKDISKLPSVFQHLRGHEYQLVQCFNYFVNAFYFVFCWFEGSAVIWTAVDIIFEHRRGGLVVPSGEALVSGRQRRGMFWIPNPRAELSYLLSKKIWKGACPDRQARRLRALVGELGRPVAERVAGELLLGKSSELLVEACTLGKVDMQFARVRNCTWMTSLVRSPLKLAVRLLSDAARCLQRWREPTGLLLVVAGPDGAGKSTLIERLVQVTRPAFRRSRTFHWRPMLLWRRQRMRDTTQPHGAPVHVVSWSVLRLFAYLLDYWFGYLILVRPLLARSGLVVFDRYFDDMWIDPKRYRFGGPVWLTHALRRLIPKPDLTLVLDADEGVLIARKQEVQRAELSRQRALYRTLQVGSSVVHVMDAAAPPAEVEDESVQAILKYLTQRVECRHMRWFR